MTACYRLLSNKFIFTVILIEKETKKAILLAFLFFIWYSKIANCGVFAVKQVNPGSSNIDAVKR